MLQYRSMNMDTEQHLCLSACAIRIREHIRQAAIISTSVVYMAHLVCGDAPREVCAQRIVTHEDRFTQRRHRPQRGDPQLPALHARVMGVANSENRTVSIWHLALKLRDDKGKPVTQQPSACVSVDQIGTNRRYQMPFASIQHFYIRCRAIVQTVTLRQLRHEH